MEILEAVLPVIVYVLLTVLLITLIVLGIKVIRLINKTNSIIEDVEEKLDRVSDIFNFSFNISDKLQYLINRLTNSLLYRKKRKDD